MRRNLKQVVEEVEGITEINSPHKLRSIKKGEYINTRAMIKKIGNENKIISVYLSNSGELFERHYRISSNGELTGINAITIDKLNPKYSYTKEN